MSGEDEHFCRCTTLKQGMCFVLTITILEAIFHLGAVCPLTWFTFEDNMMLQLGVIIPLALLTVTRVLLMIIAFNNNLDFAKRERSLIFYIISVLVEWALLIIWYVKLYNTIFAECDVTEPICHLE